MRIEQVTYAVYELVEQLLPPQSRIHKICEEGEFKGKEGLWIDWLHGGYLVLPTHK